MTKCWALGCSNTLQKGFKLFPVPQGKKNEAIRIIWMSRIGLGLINRTNFQRSVQQAFFCEVHFEPKYFEPKQPGKLKPEAIPTLFPHSTTHTKRKSPKILFTETVEASSDSDTSIQSASMELVDTTSISEEEILPDPNETTTSNAESLNTTLEIKQLESTINHMRTEIRHLNQVLSAVFNEDQIAVLNNQIGAGPNKPVTWSEETIKQALQLRLACGANGYNMLISQGFPFPPIISLNT